MPDDRVERASGPWRPASERQLEDVSIGAAVCGVLVLFLGAFVGLVVGTVDRLLTLGKDAGG